MNSLDIIVVSNQLVVELSPLMSELEGYIETKNFSLQKIIPTCINASAAVNRNHGLKQSDSDFVIMVDDDIYGYYHNWIDDLLTPVVLNKKAYISARLMRPDGTQGIMMDDGKSDVKTPLLSVLGIPTSAVGFYRRLTENISFNEDYIGSGFEDTQFCIEMRELAGAEVLINNKCKLIHVNERKSQDGVYWDYNSNIFETWKKSFEERLVIA